MRSRFGLPIMIMEAAPLLVGALAAPVRAQERAVGVVGYVLSVRGDWHAGSPAEPAVSGRALLLGDTIRAEFPPWGGHEIVIVRREGGAVRYRCADVPVADPIPAAWDCSRPIVLAPPAHVPLHARILDAVMSHFGRHATRPTSLLSRGILDREVREAVAILQSRALDLGDALSALPAGEYDATLVPIRVDGAVVSRSGPSVTARLIWDPRTAVALAGIELQPGLHELTITGGSDVAWVLICAGAGCDSVRAEFEQVRDIASQWTGQVSASDARAFVRAALDLLSREASGP